jgi:putative alpha-1,2-mannosidase
MRRSSFSTILIIVVCFAELSGCSDDPAKELYGTWKGKTRIDQNITMRIRSDSTIEIETDADSVRQIRKGTFAIVDRRLRVALDTLETYSGDVVRRQRKIDQDEALFTFTSKDEMVLRKGTQAIVLERVE